VDPTSLVLPGAQSLVAAVLSDTWEQARSALARLWARRHPGPVGTNPDTGAEPDAGAVERAARELDAVREQAIELAGQGDEAARAARMQLFLAGYLAGQLAARPELAETVRTLPDLLAAGAPDPRYGGVFTINAEKVSGSIAQARDIQGGVHFGGI
jgi:hypothetical protein